MSSNVLKAALCFIAFATLPSVANASQCVATFTTNAPSLEGGISPSYVMPKGRVIPQITEMVELAGGGREKRTFGPTQYRQTDRGPAVCFYKDYCYPANHIRLTGCALTPPDSISPDIRFLKPAYR